MLERIKQSDPDDINPCIKLEHIFLYHIGQDIEKRSYICYVFPFYTEDLRSVSIFNHQITLTRKKIRYCKAKSKITSSNHT